MERLLWTRPSLSERLASLSRPVFWGSLSRSVVGERQELLSRLAVVERLTSLYRPVVPWRMASLTSRPACGERLASFTSRPADGERLESLTRLSVWGRVAILAGLEAGEILA